MSGLAWRLRDRGVEGLPVVLVTVAVALAAVVAGTMVLPGGPVAPLPHRFGSVELVGWSLLALATGGLAIGGRGQRPPLLAAGLVGSAGLLGAGPLACAAIGAAGGLGGLRKQTSLSGSRIAAATVLGWSVPGLLAGAATAEGPALGVDHPLPLASVLALWGLLVLGIPLLESLATHLALEPSQHVGAAHMLSRRLEPHSVLAALAVLGAMAYAAIGPAAGLVVLLPAAAARVGFALHDEGRRAVAQTLAAMSVLPEWVGIVDVRHTERVSGVAAHVALQLGLDSRLRGDVVRAAELHELGHLDTGADRDDRGRVARSGAAVLAQAEVRERVQQIVHATDPDRPVHARDSDVELGAAIVSTACELDRRGRVTDLEDAAQRVVVAIGKAHRSAGAYL